MGGEAVDDLQLTQPRVVISVLVAAFVAAGMGLVLTEAGVRGSPVSVAFADGNDYTVVASLVTLQLVVWSVLGTLSWWTQAPRRRGRTTRQVAGRIALIMVGIGAAFIVMRFVTPLHRYATLPSGWDVRIVVVSAIGGLACAVVVDGLVDLVGAAEALEPGSSASSAEAFRQITRELRRSLNVLGVFLTMVVIVSGAKLTAQNDFRAVTGDPAVPNAYLLVQGAYYAGLLLLLYLPVHALIHAKGDKIANAIADADRQSDPLDQLERAQRARDALGLTQTTRAQLESGSVLLAPLLTAAITTFVTHTAG